jgi:hypothetical protein
MRLNGISSSSVSVPARIKIVARPRTLRVLWVAVITACTGCTGERHPILECGSATGNLRASVAQEHGGGAAGYCYTVLEVRGVERGSSDGDVLASWRTGCGYYESGVRLEWYGDRRLDVGLPAFLPGDKRSTQIVADDQSWAPVRINSGPSHADLDVRFFRWPDVPGDPKWPNNFAVPSAAGCFVRGARQ